MFALFTWAVHCNTSRITKHATTHVTVRIRSIHTMYWGGSDSHKALLEPQQVGHSVSVYCQLLVSVVSVWSAAAPSSVSNSLRTSTISHAVVLLQWEQGLWRMSNLQHCCFRCRWPSSLHSFHLGRFGTAGSHSVYPNRCRAARLQMAAFLWAQTPTQSNF